MAKLSVVKGATSVLIRLFIQDSSSTTGAGLTGLAYNTSSLVCYRMRDDDGNAGGTSITLATATKGTWTSGGFVEKDSTNCPGWYEFGVPNAALATGSRSVSFILKGATNMAPLSFEIELTGTDNQSASPDVNVAKINSVSTSSVTTVNANIGTTQPTNFTGTSTSALVKTDVVDFNGSAWPQDNIGRPVVDAGDIRYGTAQAGTSTSITLDSGASATDDLYKDEFVVTTGGTGSGQTKIISGYVGSTKVASITGTWAVTPDNTTTFAIKPSAPVSATVSGDVTVGAYAAGKDPATLLLTNPANLLYTDSSGRVDVGKVGGTSQTARDIGASVLISAGSGTGQLDVTSGVIKANLAQILGTALTETAGYLAAGFKKFFNIATPTSTMNEITLVDTVTTLTNPPTAIRSNTAQGGSTTTITLDAGASSTNNFYRDAIVLLTGGTGAGQCGVIASYVGSTQVATMSRSWATAPDNTTTFTLLPFGSVNVGLINGVSTSSVTTVSANQGTTQPVHFTGTGASALVQSDMVDVAGAAVSASTAQIGVNVVNFGGSAGTFASGIPTANVNGDLTSTMKTSVENAVWDATAASHASVGSTGSELNAAGASGDPWATTLPGSYSAGQAGYIIGNDLFSPIRSGTAQAGASSTITLDSGASATDNFYQNAIIVLTSGTGSGQCAIIASYVGSTKVATIYGSWATNPDNTTTFRLLPFGMVAANVNAYASGQDPATYVLATAANKLATDSSGRIDVGKILGTASAGAAGYVGTDQSKITNPTATVGLTGTTVGTVTTVTNPSGVIRSGTAQGGSTSTITLDSGASSTDSLYDGNSIEITSGTGAGQTRTISGYVGSTKVATVSSNWTVTPDNTSVFAVLPSTGSVDTNAIVAAVQDGLQAANVVVQSPVVGGVVTLFERADYNADTFVLKFINSTGSGWPDMSSGKYETVQLHAVVNGTATIVGTASVIVASGANAEVDVVLTNADTESLMSASDPTKPYKSATSAAYTLWAIKSGTPNKMWALANNKLNLTPTVFHTGT